VAKWRTAAGTMPGRLEDDLAGFGDDQDDDGGSDIESWMQGRQQQVDNADDDYAAGQDAVGASIRDGQYLAAATPDAVRALGAQQRAAGAVPAPQPIRRGDKGVLSDADKAAIIFNETRSLSGPDMQRAREYLAHAINNADETWGSDRFKHAGSAPTTIPGGVPKVEAGTYQSAMDAVAAAKEQRAKGVDPTNGALNFNFRTPTQLGPKWDRSVKTRLGPFDNSFPTDKLPKSGVYSVTY
jgi:hypothetical protein